MKLGVTGVSVRQALKERIAKLTLMNVNLTHANIAGNVWIHMVTTYASVTELVSKVTHVKSP